MFDWEDIIVEFWHQINLSHVRDIRQFQHPQLWFHFWLTGYGLCSLSARSRVRIRWQKFCFFFLQPLDLWVLLFQWIHIESLILFSLVFIFLKLLILIAMVLFFSTFMSNIITIIVTILIYFLSHSFSLLLDLAWRIKNEFLTYFIQFLQLLFPPFEAINLKDYIGSFVIWKLNLLFYFQNILYSVLYLCIMLFFTILIFNRKKFEN